MIKYFIFIITLLYSLSVQAQTLNYGDYSEAYMECLGQIDINSPNFDQQTENCRVDEIEELRREIDKLSAAIKAIPKFKEYNSMHNITLSESVQMMQKYGDIYCEMDTNIRGHSRSLNQCRLDTLNNLYIDLYNLYNVAKK